MDLLILDPVIRALYLMLLFSALPLAVSMLVGLVLSAFQAVTQIQEQTLVYLPKLLSISLILYFLGPFAWSELTNYSTDLFQHIVADVRDFSSQSEER